MKDQLSRIMGTSYPNRSELVQFLCPAPKHFCRQLIRRNGLKTALDIGCGPISLLTALRPHGVVTTGIDAWPECVEQARARNVHDHYIVGDFMAQKFDQPFDVVIFCNVIEHFDRDTGMEVLRRVETIAKRLVYVDTPNGFLEQTAHDGNPFQRHLSGWFVHDFECRGYNVFGAGPLWLQRPMGQPPRFMPVFVKRFIERVTQRYYFRRPRKAATIAAIRYRDAEGNLRQL